MRFKWLAAVVCVAAITSGCGYNEIQRQDEGTKSAWSEVVNQYQRRADLIPNLVKTSGSLLKLIIREATLVKESKSFS